MGNTSSGELARRAHYAATLPHDQRQRHHTPKVLPDLEENPRLRSTDNGVIIQSGGTISGRRPQSATLPNHSQNQHGGMYRSRSASGEGAEGRPARRALRRERDPLHRSQTHLDMHHNPGVPASVKKFGSEPDLRNEEEQPKTKVNKHFRKKYKAPAPPQKTNGDREGSSPDSYEDGSRGQPMRRLRLFKTRTESKKLTTLSSDSPTSKFSYTNDSLELNDQAEVSESRSLERRYRSPSRDKEPSLQYPHRKEMDMVQSTTSLKCEANILQTGLIKQEFKKNKNDKYNVHKSKSNILDRIEPNSQPHLERNFRHSERFKKESMINPIVLRREKSFDATLSKEATLDEADYSQPDRNRLLVEQYKKPDENQLLLCQPQRKSLPSLLALNVNEKDEFQAELIRATSRIRSDLIRSRIAEPKKDINKTEETSQNNKYGHNKINNNKEIDVKDVKKKDKAKESSRKPVHLAVSKNDTARETHVAKIHVELQKSYRTPAKQDTKRNFEDTNNRTPSKIKLEEKKSELVQFKRESRGLVDRGQGSGKESTPEQSLNRINESDKIWDNRDANPKQFYFGMIESNDIKITDKVKEFPGLGAPINGDFKNFDIIEKKLLNYPNDEMEVEKFANKIQHTTLNNRNLSSESALSSEPEIDDHNSDENLQGIALHLRPTLPKKQLEIPRFSPAAAWRQLAAMEAVRGTSPLAVDTKPAPDSVASEAAGRGSLDKSADSGISGDTPHDDRLDSPPRSNQHALAPQSRPIISAWTPQQDLEGDSSSDPGQESPSLQPLNDTVPAKFSARNQVFSLSLPRETHFANSAEKSKQLQQPFNSLQKLKKSVSGALGVALGGKRPDDQEHIMDDQSDQNWFLSKSAPNSLSNAFLYPHQMRQAKEMSHENIGEEVTPPASDQEEEERPPVVIPSMLRQQPPFSYLATGGHVMYLPRYESQREPASYQHEDRRRKDSSAKLWRDERLLRTKSSGEIEMRSRKQEPSLVEEPPRHEMRERNQSVSPAMPRAKRQVDQPKSLDTCQGKGRGKRFTFQSTVRQLERRRLAERLSREADLKEQQRKNELEAMRRVEEEFQRKRAREKASIRQQLRLVSGATSLPPLTAHQQPARDDPDGAVSSSPSPGRGDTRGDARGDVRGDTRGDTRGDSRVSPDASDKQSPYVGRLASNRAARPAEPARRHSKNSSSTHSKSTTNSGPTTRVLSEWRVGGERRQYRDWGAPASIDHPPACYRMPNANHNGNDREFEGFSGSPRSDNYRLEFARGSHGSSSGSELSAHRTRKPQSDETNTSATSDKAEPEVAAKGGREPEIIPTLLKAPPAPIIRGELLKIH